MRLDEVHAAVEDVARVAPEPRQVVHDHPARLAGLDPRHRLVEGRAGYLRAGFVEVDKDLSDLQAIRLQLRAAPLLLLLGRLERDAFAPADARDADVDVHWLRRLLIGAQYCDLSSSSTGSCRSNARRWRACPTS